MMKIDEFINGYESAALTKKSYRQSLEIFQRFLGKAQPSERKVEEFLQHLHEEDQSNATICRHLSAIRVYFTWMKKHVPKEERVDWDLEVKGPKLIRKLPVYRSDDDIKRIITAAKAPFHRALVMLLYDCALRIEEAMTLEAGDVDYAGGYIKITRKGGLETRLPVSEDTLKAVKRYVGSRRGKIFVQPYWRLHYEIKKLANQAGLKNFTPHQFRHGRACQLRANDVALEDIQEFLGHKNIQTTEIYARMMPEGLKKKIAPAF